MLPTLVALVLLAGPQDLSPAQKRKIDYARADVEKNPDSPKANLELGKLLCLEAGDWAEGLPHLAKGGDKDFAPLAEKDLAGGNALERIDVADQWFTLSKKHKAAKDRALAVYGEAWPKLTDDVWRGKLRERLRALQAKGPEAKTLGPIPAGWPTISSKQNAGADRQYARSGAFSVKILAPQAGLPPGTMQSWLRSDEFPCTPGQKFTFSVWVLTDGSEGPKDQLTIRFKDRQDKFLNLTGPRAEGDLPVWTKIEGEAVAPEGATRVDVGFYRGTQQGVVWVDDFSLKVDGKELLKNPGVEAR